MSSSNSAGGVSHQGTLDEKLLAEFAPLIRYMAYRYSFRLPPSMDTDDLIHAGILGLMDALDKYDSAKEARFKTYAEFRIRGAMLDEIRSQNWIPRSIQEKISLLNRTTEELSKRLGREPEPEELGAELNMEKKELDLFLYQARASSLLSLDDLGLENSDEKSFYEALANDGTEDPLFSLLSQESNQKLVKAIALLPEKEKWVISLYYREELNMKDIGKILKVTESRVCQLHAQAIIRLKTELAKSE
ncbi:MAG: FliA/WhiG family RNA polymerase sigma factor [Nitrospirae bacterium]|nr:FliA/WhiG family RNA polymerase sigma factor [Nitrospirota bacterium]MBI3594032.1 FliA/WhiG family RNA polymerase sigma factor [Nitrospirota bacterium]